MSSERSLRRKAQLEFEAMLNETYNVNEAFEDEVIIDSVGTLGGHVEYLGEEICLVSQSFVEHVDRVEANGSQFVKPNLGHQLAVWAVKHNIKSNAIDSLLRILNVNNPDLPKCSKTLLRTPSSGSYKIVEIEGGQYHHFGLKKKLLHLDSQKLIPENTHSLDIQIGIDGLPISKSSKRQFWPILAHSPIINNSIPFLIGLYFSNTTKPLNVTEYLKPTATELYELLQNGIWLGTGHCNINLQVIIADAPARNLIKSTVGFNAYHGCERCTHKGIWLGRVTFQDLNAKLRTDSDFKLQTDKSHHSGISPFLGLNIGLVSQVPLDYMHLICLGVVKKRLKFWKKGKPLQFRLGRHELNIISERLAHLKRYTTSEFSRKPRTLSELDFWKATEFRSFLLYYGPVVLKGDVISNAKYNHFLLLSVAVRLLVSNCKEGYKHARVFLRRFVQLIPEMYGSEFMVYNVHSLIHIADDAETHGSLDSINAFKFENYMQTLKSMIRSRNFELSQVIRRVSEYENLTNSILIPKTLMLRVKCDLANSTFQLVDGRVVKLIEVDIALNQIQFKVYKSRKNFFEYPLNSVQVGIYQFSFLSDKIEIGHPDMLKYKMFCMLLKTERMRVSSFICSTLCGQDA